MASNLKFINLLPVIEILKLAALKPNNFSRWEYGSRTRPAAPIFDFSGQIVYNNFPEHFPNKTHN